MSSTLNPPPLSLPRFRIAHFRRHGAETSRKMRLITDEVQWSGVADSEERRRIQNRVNQRAARQRKLEKDKEAGVVRRARGRPKGSVKKSPTSSSSPESTAAVIQPFRICEVNTATVTTFIDQLFTSVNNGLKTGHPKADLLLSLTQFNAFRAMMQNISSLGLTLEIMKDPESISTFNSKTQIGNLPPSLQPTALQSAMPHHPWIDPFPIPSFRDALLLQDGAYDEDAFCNDLLGECGSPGGQVGIIVWGDHPFDPMGYEMTEAFAKKWAWLLQGCWELKASTDYWRRSRGERPIFEVEELE